MKKRIFLLSVVLVFVGLGIWYFRMPIDHYQEMAASDDPKIQLVYLSAEMGKIVGPCMGKDDKLSPEGVEKCVCPNKEMYVALIDKTQSILEKIEGKDINLMNREISSENQAKIEAIEMHRNLTELRKLPKQCK